MRLPVPDCVQLHDTGAQGCSNVCSSSRTARLPGQPGAAVRRARAVRTVRRSSSCATPAKPRPVSFRELDAGCNAVARGLVKAGLKPGDRIGILSLNRAEFVMTLLGAMRAGVVPVPVNIKLPADTVAYILGDAGARLVFAEPDTETPDPAWPARRAIWQGLWAVPRPGAVRGVRARAGLGRDTALYLRLDRPAERRAADALRPELEPAHPRAHARHDRTRRDPGRRAAVPQERAERDQAGPHRRRDAAAAAAVRHRALHRGDRPPPLHRHLRRADHDGDDADAQGPAREDRHDVGAHHHDGLGALLAPAASRSCARISRTPNRWWSTA